MKNPFKIMMNKLGDSAKARLITLISMLVVIALLTAAVIVLAVNLAAKPDIEPDPVIPEGPESGLYYYDNSNGKEYTLQLHSGNKFTLYDGVTKVGTYTVTEDAVLALTFEKEDYGNAEGTIADGVLTLNYNNSQARYLL